MADKQVLEKRADALLALHQPGNPVVLPTVWDAWSAKLAVDAGFCRADRRQPPGRRFDRQARQRGHDVRRPAHPRRADHRCGGRPGLRRHRVRLRRGAARV